MANENCLISLHVSHLAHQHNKTPSATRLLSPSNVRSRKGESAACDFGTTAIFLQSTQCTLDGAVSKGRRMPPDPAFFADEEDEADDGDDADKTSSQGRTMRGETMIRQGPVFLVEVSATVQLR